MTITIPELSLVLLVGPSGAGKSTFARKHFKPTEVLSSDYFRGLVCDDETNQAASKDAFETLHFVAARPKENPPAPLHRRTQRPARGAKAAARAGAPVSLPHHGDRL